MNDFEKHPTALPEVAGPNSVPTGGRFETSTENYSDGAPDLPEPDWLRQESRRKTFSQIELGVALEADELGNSSEPGQDGYVLYERTERGWQATFHDK